MRVTLRRGLPNTLGLQTLGIRRCLSALDFFFFFASPDEEGADVVAVFFLELFKFLSNEEDDDDVEAEAEAEAESLSPVAIVAFSLSSFVAFHHHLSVDKKMIAHSGENASMMHFVFSHSKLSKKTKKTSRRARRFCSSSMKTKPSEMILCITSS